MYQRQLAAERRKTIGVMEENQNLRQTLEELTQKLRVSRKDPTEAKGGVGCSVVVDLS